jgi:ABC-type nickel/cobalt efflux system permease component RcnA
MRFQRADLPGMAIAALAPPALFVLFLASFETWDHRGTLLFAFVSSGLAITIGVVAIFSRFVRRWELMIGLAVVLAVIVTGVNLMQRTDNDGTALATTLKLAGVVDVALLAAVFGYQAFINGLLPVLDRRSARRAAAAESTEQ